VLSGEWWLRSVPPVGDSGPATLAPNVVSISSNVAAWYVCCAIWATEIT
jgi:hypothetical protein